MSERTFHFEVITPDRVVLRDDTVVSIIVPGSEGHVGVLANHAPMMAELVIGKLDFRRSDGKTGKMAISGGFLEVYENSVSGLAQSGELAEDIDVARAEESKKRAKERLSAARPDIDEARAEAALQRAINRLKIARQT